MSGPVVDDPRREPSLAEPRGIRSRTGFLATSGTAPRSPPKTLRLADHLALVEEQPRLEGAKAPVEQLARLRLRPVAGRLEAVHHHDQPLPVLHRRADQAEAGLVDVARLQAVGADVHGQQRVAVLLADLVPGELPLPEDLVEVRVGLDDVQRRAWRARAPSPSAPDGRSRWRCGKWSASARARGRARSSSARSCPRCRRCPPRRRSRRRCRTGR